MNYVFVYSAFNKYSFLSETAVVTPLSLLSLSFSLRISVFLARIYCFNLQRVKVSSVVVAYIRIPVEHGQPYTVYVFPPLLIQMWVIKCRDIANSFEHEQRLTPDQAFRKVENPPRNGGRDQRHIYK